jgi:hypothetical protein
MENFKQKFTPPNNDHSYYPLLFLAMETTEKGDILELGTGYGSTPLLHEYLKERKGRLLFSFEEKKEWLDKFTHLECSRHSLKFITDWDYVKNTHPDAAVIFIDHAPGERRKEDIVKYKDTKGIIVCHDTEPAADYGYQMRQYFPMFKYVVEVKTDGAWATAMSNEYDITNWVGETFDKYTISPYNG